MTNYSTRKFRELCETSARDMPAIEADEIQRVRDQLQAELTQGSHYGKWFEDNVVTESSAYTRPNMMREINKQLRFEDAIGDSNEISEAISHYITQCLPNDRHLKSLDDTIWPSAIAIARVLMLENGHNIRDDRISAVCLAASRLNARGYALSVGDNSYEFSTGELERITNDIVQQLEMLGPFGVLRNLLLNLSKAHKFEYEMFLTSRRVSQTPNARPPSVPFGFLLNLGVKLKPVTSEPSNAGELYEDSINLARDAIACLNIEPYSTWTYMFPDPGSLEKYFRELALFDHLFIFRQWRYSFIEFFIDHFFMQAQDDLLKHRLGWDLDDVKNLVRSVEPFAKIDGNLVTHSALITGGVPRGILQPLLNVFAHPDSQVNQGYDSPLAAQRCNLIFKPFLSFGPNHIWINARSLIGPAIYEAIMVSLRPLLSRGDAANLPGAGTERVCAALFHREGLTVSHVGSKYNMQNIGAGECDLVIESDTDILLIECKAKAPTRAAMSGSPGEALIDFCAGVFKAQAQALRHERILSTNGRIVFEDGSELVKNDRNITRLNVTLLDHGALQDRTILFSVFERFRVIALNVDPSSPRASQIDEINDDLNMVRQEVERLEAAGLSSRDHSLNVASLSLGQMDVLLEGVHTLPQILKRISRRVVFGTLNPILEYVYIRQQLGEE